MAPSTFDRNALAGRLRRGIGELGLEIDAGGQAKLLDYLELLVRWNGVYNLSGIKEPERMLGLHLLDSLSILPLVRGEFILDAGTGAGLPGIPLAICLPSTHFILLDSNGKKTRFLLQAAASLDLPNVEVRNERLEGFQSPRQLDMVVTRAFSSLRQSLAWAGHLIGAQGSFLAMKGHFPKDEVEDLPPEFVLAASHALRIPGEDCERHVLEIKRAP